MSDRASHPTPYGRRGTMVRLAYLVLALLWWLAAWPRPRTRHGAIVLCYHNVTARQAARFAWQMRMIASTAASIDRIVSEPATGSRIIGVTFDDGFASLLDHAMPELEHHRVPATIFAVTGRPGAAPYWPMPVGHPDTDEPTMTEGQLRDLDGRSLFAVESHTVSHHDLRTLADATLEHELEHARSTLERWLTRPVTHLALPFGADDDRVRRAAMKAGYRHVYTLKAQVNRVSDGTGVIGRFSVSPEMWRIEFRLTVAGAYAWLDDWRQWRRRRVQRRPAIDSVPERLAA